MSKKMKGVASNPSPYGFYEDAKTRLKHHTLLQDYQELQMETNAIRDKLEAMKQRKLTLLTEVRFLRRRHKYLLKVKSQRPPVEQVVQPQNLERHRRSNLKEKIHGRKDATFQNTAPISGVNKKAKISSGKGSATQKRSQALDFNQMEGMHSGKEPSLLANPKERRYGGRKAIYPSLAPVLDLNKDRMITGSAAASRNPSPGLDQNQVDRATMVKESTVQCGSPIFDLNQISREQLEFQDNYEPKRIEEPKKSVIRGGTDDPSNDLKLALCRNVGNGKRTGKRKLSWQDPVALKV